jgi:hypothetical protein
MRFVLVCFAVALATQGTQGIREGGGSVSVEGGGYLDGEGGVISWPKGYNCSGVLRLI